MGDVAIRKGRMNGSAGRRGTGHACEKMVQWRHRVHALADTVHVLRMGMP